MKTDFLLLLIVVLGLLTFGVDAQNKPIVSKLSGKNFALDKTKPTIYLEYVTIESRQRSSDDSLDDMLWLRLRNNSRWGIRLEMSGGLDKKLQDAKLYYDIIDRSENIIAKKRCHVCSSNILRSGKSILFAIPKDSLLKNLSIRVNFRYEWEDDVRIAPATEPTHYVFFSSDELPDK